MKNTLRQSLTFFLTVLPVALFAPCASAGDTEEEAIANAKEALELWFEPTEIPLAESAKLIEVSA